MSLGKGFDKGRPECNVLVSLGFVIAVQLFQFLIQDGRKKVEVLGFFFKLYQPFVCSVSFFAEVNRACSVVCNNCFGDLAGFGDGPLGVVDDQFFAKGIDVKLQAAYYFYPERCYTGELNRVSDQVTPEPSIGADDRSIVLP
jgi:hypothetical protein